MAVISIVSFQNVADGNVQNGLLKKVYATEQVERFEVVGFNGKKAFAKAGSTNVAYGIALEAGVFNTAYAGQAIALSTELQIELATALSIGTPLYLANTNAGASGQIVTDAPNDAGDLIQVVGYVVPDRTGGATSKNAVLKFVPQATTVYGAFLSTVAVDATLTGNGTAGSPLHVA